jgi:hypothetical protein
MLLAVHSFSAGILSSFFGFSLRSLFVPAAQSAD